MLEEYIPMEELIKSGEVDGREALEYLAGIGEYVFHGSAVKLDELEPRQAMSEGLPDGEPAVCATTKVDHAIFRALINREHDKRAGRSQHYSAWSGMGDTTEYLTLRTSLDGLSDEDKGYVYAMVKGLFVPYRGEMRSNQLIVPDFTVEVSRQDLPEVKVFDSIEQLREYQAELRKRQQGGKKD